MDGRQLNGNLFNDDPKRLLQYLNNAFTLPDYVLSTNYVVNCTVSVSVLSSKTMIYPSPMTSTTGLWTLLTPQGRRELTLSSCVERLTPDGGRRNMKRRRNPYLILFFCSFPFNFPSEHTHTRNLTTRRPRTTPLLCL